MARQLRPSTGTATRRREPVLPPEVTHVDYKDAELLRRFISDRGKIRARHITGITPQQQRAVSAAIKNAREMALLAYPTH